MVLGLIVKYYLIGIALIIIALCFIRFANKTYSEGNRTGVITKLSCKGLIWKTYEGQMNVGGMSAKEGGVMVPVVWSFTAPSALKETLEQCAQSGERTTIKYRQVFIQWPWNGETDYNVVGIATK